MSTEVSGIPPPVLWAQRTDTIFLTFNVECKDPQIRFENQLVHFKGTGLPEKKSYEVTIPLYGEIKPEECVKHNIGRCIEVLLVKGNKSSPFWPSLTKDKKKLHWLKIDFSKIQDENDSGDEQRGGGGGGPPGAGHTQNLEDLMKSMGGLRDNDEKPSFDAASDSDDEDLPDLE